MIFLDANAIIYLLEGEPALQKATRRILEQLRAGDSDALIAVSALSLLECRVQPLRNSDQARVQMFDDLSNPPYSPPCRREGPTGPVAGAFCDRAHRKRTCLYGEDARPSETPWTRGLVAPQ